MLCLLNVVVFVRCGVQLDVVVSAKCGCVCYMWLCLLCVVVSVRCGFVC